MNKERLEECIRIQDLETFIDMAKEEHERKDQDQIKSFEYEDFIVSSIKLMLKYDSYLLFIYLYLSCQLLRNEQKKIIYDVAVKHLQNLPVEPCLRPILSSYENLTFS